MKRILITGAGSYIGTKVEEWLKQFPELFSVDSVDTLNDNWKSADFSKYDVVYNVAGIAHVKAKKSEEALYYAVNRDMVIEIAKAAKAAGVKHFIHMSSMIVYKEVKTLKGKKIHLNTKPAPNGFYGDSKLQGEKGIKALESPLFKVCILRPPMIYGPGCKGNFPKLVWLSAKTPIFPAWHNKRSMLYIDNLCEFVRQVILNGVNGIVFPQNGEYADTVEIVRYFSKQQGKTVWITKLLNPVVWITGNFVRQVGKMFSDSTYDLSMSLYPFDYQLVSFKDSLKRIETPKKDK